MNRIRIIREQDRRKRWDLLPLHYFYNGGPLLLTCENGHVMVLRHSVKDNGEVEPSVVCGTPECSFHAFVLLENWKQQD